MSGRPMLRRLVPAVHDHRYRDLMASMVTLVIAHEPDGPACVIEDRLIERGFSVHTHVVCPDADHPNRARPFPSLDGYDLLVVMGSIRSLTNKDEISSWIHDELDLLKTAHTDALPLLGICFGGQVLADALGGRVEIAPNGEFGWHRIELDPGAEIPVSRGPWMQWHHDRFTPPDGAEILARSPEGVQLFRMGTTVGTQFHPEVDVEHVASWLDSAPEAYLIEVGIDTEALLAETAQREDDNRRRCNALVDWYLDDVVAVSDR